MQGLGSRCKEGLEVIGQQFPFELFKHLQSSLRLTFAEGISLLQEAGYEVRFCLARGAWLMTTAAPPPPPTS